MVNTERPLCLTPVHDSIFGNDKSNRVIAKAYDRGFERYKELIESGWSDNDAMRDAYCTMIGFFEGTIHTLASEEFSK